MAKVTYSATKGLVVESGTGFQVNDAPILEEIEAVTLADGADTDAEAFGVTNATSDGSGNANQVLNIPDADGAGQVKTVHFTDGGGATADTCQIRGTNVAGVADQVLATPTATNDWVHLLWTGAGWAVIGSTIT